LQSLQTIYFQNTGVLPAFGKLALKYRPSGNPTYY